MITRWQYSLSAAMITRWHYYIDAVMITRWPKISINVFAPSLVSDINFIPCQKTWCDFAYGDRESVEWSSSVARGGPRGYGTPKLLVNVFSSINLHCYVILVCK